MKSKLLSPVGLSPEGQGPRIFAFAIPFLITGIICGIFWPIVFRFGYQDISFFRWAGVAVLISGVIFYIIAIKQFMRDFSSGELITRGAFSISRNPIYSSWMVLILPGLSLIFNNWMFLMAAISMLFAFLALIRKEEEALARIYGQQYTLYTLKVGRIL